MLLDVERPELLEVPESVHEIHPLSFDRNKERVVVLVKAAQQLEIRRVEKPRLFGSALHPRDQPAGAVLRGGAVLERPGVEPLASLVREAKPVSGARRAVEAHDEVGGVLDNDRLGLLPHVDSELISVAPEASVKKLNGFEMRDLLAVRQPGSVAGQPELFVIPELDRPGARHRGEYTPLHLRGGTRYPSKGHETASGLPYRNHPENLG